MGGRVVKVVGCSVECMQVAGRVVRVVGCSVSSYVPSTNKCPLITEAKVLFSRRFFISMTWEDLLLYATTITMCRFH